MVATTVILVLLMIALPILLSGFLSKPASAANNDTWQITLMVAESGAPTNAVFTVTDACGTPSPATIADDGVQHNISAPEGSSCPLTLTVPIDGSNTRFRFTPLSTTAAFPDTVGGSGGTMTDNATVYYQQSESVSYSISYGGSDYSAPTLDYTSLGSSAATYPMTTTATTEWLDYGTSWSVTPNPLTGSGANERWDANASISGSASAGGTISPAYYNQFLHTLSYSVIDGGTPTAPTATGTEFSSAYVPSLTTTATGYWFDATGSITISTPTSGANERWSPSPVSVSATSSGTQIISMYNQYQQILSYSITDGGSGYSAPTATGAELGTVYAPNLTMSATGYWFDTSDSITFINPLGGSSSVERWYTSILSISATVQGTNAIVYDHQYPLTVIGGNGISYGTPSPTSDNWYYASTSTTISSSWVWNTVAGESRTAITDYQLDSVSQNPTREDSGTLTTSSVTFDAAHTVAFMSTTQYNLIVSGGNNVAYGTASQTGDNWYDSGTSTTVSSNGIYARASGTGQRVTSWSIDGDSDNSVATTGTVTTTSLTMSTHHTVAFNTVTQYQLTLNVAATSALVSCTTPTIAGDNYWYDNGTTGVSCTLNGVYGRTSTTGTRVTSYNWDGNSNASEATTGTFTASAQDMSSAHQLNANTVTQYLLTDNDPTNSESSITPSTIAGDTGWYDSGTSVTVVLNNVYGLVPNTSRNNLVSYTKGDTTTPVTRSGSGTVTEGAIVMSAPVTISATYVVQYYLAISNDCYNAAVSATSQTGDGWYDSGTPLDVQCNGINTRGAGTGKRAEDYYWDSDPYTTESTTGTYTTSAVTTTSAHTLNVDAVIQFQVAFAASPIEGGSASTSTPPPISGDAGWYDSGSAVSISASPNAYWSFALWSANTGSITFGSTSSESTTATIGGSGTMTAGFEITTPLSVSVSPVTIDSGHMATLTAVSSGGSSSYTSYAWYQGDSCSGTVLGTDASYTTAALTSTTDYCVQVTDSFGDTATTTVTVTISTSLSVSVSPATIDKGQAATLTAVPSGGSGGYSYLWYPSSCPPSGSSIGASTSYTTPALTSTTSYCAMVTDSFGVNATTAVIVTVNSVLFMSSLSAISTPTSVTITVVFAGGTAPYSYQWYTGSTCASGNAIPGAAYPSYTASPLTPTTYSVNVTDGSTGTPAANICTAVTVGLGGTTLTLSPSAIDTGQTANVTALVTWGGGTSPYSVTLYSGTSRTCSSDSTLVSTKTGIVGTSTTFSLTAPGSTTYYCATVTDSETSPVTVTTSAAPFTVNPTMAATISPPSSTIQRGQPITLRAEPSLGTQPYSYQWYNGSACASGSAIPGRRTRTYTVSPTSAATYSVAVTDRSTGTPAAIICASAAVTVEPAFVPPIIIGCSRSSIVVGMTTTCRVKTEGNGSVPIGTVIWSSSSSGAFSRTSCALSLHGGYSMCSVRFKPTAADSPVILRANYGGDSRDSNSSSTFNLVVTMKTSMTRVSCTPRSAVVGSSTVITCTVKVTGYLPTGTVGWSQTTSSTGSVSFTSTTCTLASLANPNKGTCSVAMTGLTSGHVIINATYMGDSNNNGSSRRATLTIRKAYTVTTISCTESSFGIGTPITCTATIYGHSPTETVTWSKISGTGGITFSSTTCGLSSGSCSVTVTATHTGSVKVKAAYGGDSNNIRRAGTLVLTIT